MLGRGDIKTTSRYARQAALGLAVALEGLHNVVRSGKAKPAQIVGYARDTRIWSVLRPYLETVVADGA